jgi:formylglycine-generating enzyme
MSPSLLTPVTPSPSRLAFAGSAISRDSLHRKLPRRASAGRRTVMGTCIVLVGLTAIAHATPWYPRVVQGPGVALQLAPAEPPPEPTSASSCPADMLEVDGDYCPALEQRCLRWLDPDTKLRCAEFDRTGRCQTKTVHKHFCIDKYEYPNRAGEKPVVMQTWYEAGAACKKRGKRLCRDSEWTLACEGAERTPYPYGYARNTQACNIDQPRINPNEKALGNPLTRDAEVARLDLRAASGAYAACVSPYGVHDMAGNVDEWVVNESGTPYQSGSKGGYWGPVRTRCRPMTVAHYELFSFYQLGFRCCGDVPPGSPSAGSATPPGPSFSASTGFSQAPTVTPPSASSSAAPATSATLAH